MKPFSLAAATACLSLAAGAALAQQRVSPPLPDPDMRLALDLLASLGGKRWRR